LEAKAVVIGFWSPILDVAPIMKAAFPQAFFMTFYYQEYYLGIKAIEVLLQLNLN
jgi:hypothetical protein